MGEKRKVREKERGKEEGIEPRIGMRQREKRSSYRDSVGTERSGKGRKVNWVQGQPRRK